MENNQKHDLALAIMLQSLNKPAKGKQVEAPKKKRKKKAMNGRNKKG